MSGPVTGPVDDATFAALLEMTGGEIGFVDELVDTYLDDGRAQLDALRTALAGGDGATAELVRAAHSLKSGSLNVGALELGALCRSLEEDARGGALPDAAERVAAIEAGFGKVRTALLDARGARHG